MADFRQVLNSVVSRPDKFGLDRRYATLVAFITGYHAATDCALLDGFRDFVGQRALGVTETPYHWAAVIAAEHGVNNFESTPPEMNDELRTALAELLYQFLADGNEKARKLG